MVEPIMANGLLFKRIRSSGQASDVSSSQMALNIKDRLRKDSSTARAEWLTQTVIFIKVNGKMAKLLELVFLLTSKVQCMRDSGRMINITVKELNNGITTKSYTLVTLLMAKRLERVNSSSTEMSMREISSMANSTVRENTISLSQERFTKEDSKRITCTVKERWRGPMVPTMKVISKTVKLMDKE